MSRRSRVGRPLPVAARNHRGVAALVVVMVLFFIVSLVAAYSSRTLIFEQRTSANQYRATASLEAAEAGLEWALAMLNSGLIAEADCTATAPPGTSFRDRYLAIDPANGRITPKIRSGGAGELWPSCTFDGAKWACSCPADAAPTMGASGAAYRVRFKSIGSADPGLVRVEVKACTAPEETCLAFAAVPNDRCGGTVCIVASLFPGVRAAPTAAITARGAFDLGGAALTAANGNVGGSGVTIHTGGAVNTVGLKLMSRAGTPGASSVYANDPALSDVKFTSDRMFASVFGVWPAQYREQPAAVEINCAGTCGAKTLSDAIAGNPGRPLWLNGSVDFDDAAFPIGTAALPVVLVATGDVRFSVAMPVFGLVYNHAAAWTTAGPGTVQGAIAASGSIAGNSTMTVAHDGDVLKRLRFLSGSFVRAPGSWRDYP